jgi:uncharacterized protein YcfJ
MNKAIRRSLAAIVLGATALGGLAAAPAAAQRHDNDRHDGRWDRRDGDRGRHPDRDDRRAPPPRIIYRYYYDRPDPRYGRYYHPDRYYRAGYRPIVITRQTRIYRGGDGRYYCRRSDGTTGLVVGAVVGGVIGNRLDRGDSSVLGALLGAGAGAAIGRELDRGAVTCR